MAFGRSQSRDLSKNPKASKSGRRASKSAARKEARKANRTRSRSKQPSKVVSKGKQGGKSSSRKRSRGGKRSSNKRVSSDRGKLPKSESKASTASKQSAASQSRKSSASKRRTSEAGSNKSLVGSPRGKAAAALAAAKGKGDEPRRSSKQSSQSQRSARSTRSRQSSQSRVSQRSTGSQTGRVRHDADDLLHRAINEKLAQLDKNFDRVRRRGQPKTLLSAGDEPPINAWLLVQDDTAGKESRLTAIEVQNASKLKPRPPVAKGLPTLPSLQQIPSDLISNATGTSNITKYECQCFHQVYNGPNQKPTVKYYHHAHTAVSPVASAVHRQQREAPVPRSSGHLHKHGAEHPHKHGGPAGHHEQKHAGSKQLGEPKGHGHQHGAEHQHKREACSSQPSIGWGWHHHYGAHESHGNDALKRSNPAPRGHGSGYHHGAPLPRQEHPGHQHAHRHGPEHPHKHGGPQKLPSQQKQPGKQLHHGSQTGNDFVDATDRQPWLPRGPSSDRQHEPRASKVPAGRQPPYDGRTREPPYAGREPSYGGREPPYEFARPRGQDQHRPRPESVKASVRHIPRDQKSSAGSSSNPSKQGLPPQGARPSHSINSASQEQPARFPQIPEASEISTPKSQTSIAPKAAGQKQSSGHQHRLPGHNHPKPGSGHQHHALGHNHPKPAHQHHQVGKVYQPKFTMSVTSIETESILIQH